MVHRVTTNENEWERVKTSGTTSGTTNDNEWKRVVQRVTTSGTTSDNEWQRVIQRVTMSDNKLQWVTASDNRGTTN